MLNNRTLNDKSYDQKLAEAISQIPLYTEDWTNFNPSDPGITTLENFTAYSTIQQQLIDAMTPEVREKLLKMVGMKPERGKSARVLVTAEGLGESVTLPAGHGFDCSGIVFETPRQITLFPHRLVGIGRLSSGQMQMRRRAVSAVSEKLDWKGDKLEEEELGYISIDSLLDRDVSIPWSVFGDRPKKGDALFMLADGLPSPGEEIIVYVHTPKNRKRRNEIPPRGRNIFAEILWECYTEEGLKKMSVLDKTGGFLYDGEIRMRLPETPAAKYPDMDGNYLITATLLRADYDVEPMITGVDGFMFELVQRETKSVCISNGKHNRINIYNNILDEGYITVLVKEEKGASYRKYERAPFDDAKGRYFDYIREGEGMHSFIFDRKAHGYGPDKLRDAVKVLAYTEDIMRQYSLGKVYGYDNQRIKLPMGHVVAETFSIMARRTLDNGENIYDFVKPERNEEGSIFYHLYEEEGFLVIEDPGDYIDADLFVGAFSVFSGEQGNVRAGNEFLASGNLGKISFMNPGPGQGGRFSENLEDVRRRFIADIKKPYCAVTASDFEKIAGDTPQLIIEKVRAYCDHKNGIVKIAVKPGTDEEFPELSGVYRDNIRKHLEESRLLNTALQILSPVYVPVEVRATIYSKPQYGDCVPEIEKAVKSVVDYGISGANFGEILKFEDVINAISDLDCVKIIYDLRIRPMNNVNAKVVESDILPVENGLCYLGSIQIETGKI